MPILYQKMIYRDDLKANPNVHYVFGDNKQRIGMGGQAREMRSEPNAIGVITKYAPTADQYAYLNDDRDFEWYRDYLFSPQADLFKIKAILVNDGIVVFPTDGIGTGLADMKNKAPECWSLLNNQLEKIKKNFGPVPWGSGDRIVEAYLSE